MQKGVKTMVQKCKRCGEYRMHLDDKGVCSICRKEENGEDLEITVNKLVHTVKSLEKKVNQLDLALARMQRVNKK